MKKILIISCLVALATTTLNAQEYISKARKYSKSLSEKLMKDYSPNTGRNNDYDLDYESIIYDSHANEIECLVEITWEAKKTILFSHYDKCIVKGKLYIYLNEQDRYGNVKTKFVPRELNEWAKQCASSHGWNAIAALTLYLIVQ
ncbi:MAG: hypothetical protein LBG80_10245 [Bacteroidales bacterium]|jgi:hypothetical protein|nr:hypothetical protein [Bacteroidales bacterium]